LKTLRDFGAGVGALLTVLGLIMTSIVPERQHLTLTIAAIGLLVMVAGLALNRARVAAALRGRRARAASASVGYTLVVLAVVILINFMAGRHHKRFDLTENHDFSLSEQTIKVVEGLPREVTLTSFSRETDPGTQKLKDLLAEYSYHNSKLTVRYVDPDKNPGEVKRYNVTELGTIIVESGKQETRINASDEEALTNALIKVTSDKERVVYATTGHGEHGLEDKERAGLALLKGALEKQNYVVKPLTLNQGVPADASAVLVAGPAKPFLEAEVKMISDYLDRGGRLLLMQDPGVNAGFDAILARYGAAVRKDVVIDKVSQLFGGDARIPMVPPEGYDHVHPITKSFAFQTMYPLASSIDIKSPLPPGVTAVALAKTSDMSWGETSEEEFKTGHIQLNEGVDTRGPITVAAALEHKAEPAEPPKAPDGSTPDSPDPKASGPDSRIVLFGDSDFAGNNYFNAGGNGDFALSGIAWLVEQGELISIRAKTTTPRVVILSPAQVFYYFWSIVAVAPLTIALVGVFIWYRRKRL
jgi:ABC-type uncharacterized transport system involved in gliding motility auxiliary subunit